jgi:AcrR family transcriptional regulator
METQMALHSETRREEIIRSAARPFRENGFSKTTVRDLSVVAGIQSGSLYHHFDTKLEILISLMEDTLLLNKEYLINKISIAKTIEEKVYNLIKGELELLFGERGDASAVVIHEWNRISLEDKKTLTSLRIEYENIWTNVFAEAQSSGLISIDTDIVILRRLLYGAIVWTSNWYKLDGRLDLDGMTHQILLLALKTPCSDDVR